MLLLAACGGSDDDVSPTTQPSGTPPADADAIRDVDMTQQKDVAAAITRIGGGSVAKNEIVYADLTGDQREEAVVPITSGGTMGNLSYLIFTPSAGGATLLLTRNLDPSSPSGITMAVENGILVEYIGEYGPEDPMCCPSVLRRTTFKWDGSKLQVAGEERQQRPQKQ
ncbi:MAG: hypothetical protein AB7P33_14460 [Dehalococcoidia bacterium]